jgi:gamma-tubulin complex component 2
MKHFFFLDQSEFLNQFFDNAHSELKKPSSSSSITKIQSLLYMAVSNPASASSLDPHKEQLRVVMASTPLYDWLLKVVSKKAGEGIMAAMKASLEEKAEDTAKKEKERDISSKFCWPRPSQKPRLIP